MPVAKWSANKRRMRGWPRPALDRFVVSGQTPGGGPPRTLLRNEQFNRCPGRVEHSHELPVAGKNAELVEDHVGKVGEGYKKALTHESRYLCPRID